MADVLVLCYHAVSEDWPADLSVTPGALEEQLAHLVSRGYQGATFQQALEAPQAPKTVAVTFDDAYCSVAQLAFPILDQLGLPGTVFVPTDFAGTAEPMRWDGIDGWLGGAHEHELVPLSWNELGGLRDAGWEVGSHTCSHPRLTWLDQAGLERELGRSRAECEERLGGVCTSLAYPYGDLDGRVVAAARAAGYRFGAGLPEGRWVQTPLAWPRVGVYFSDSLARFRRQTSVWTRRVRAVAPSLVPVLGRARAMLPTPGDAQQDRHATGGPMARK